jgi:hypothetical protein
VKIQVLDNHVEINTEITASFPNTIENNAQDTLELSVGFLSSSITGKVLGFVDQSRSFYPSLHGDLSNVRFAVFGQQEYYFQVTKFHFEVKINDSHNLLEETTYIIDSSSSLEIPLKPKLNLTEPEEVSLTIEVSSVGRVYIQAVSGIIDLGKRTLGPFQSPKLYQITLSVTPEILEEPISEPSSEPVQNDSEKGIPGFPIESILVGVIIVIILIWQKSVRLG